TGGILIASIVAQRHDTGRTDRYVNLPLAPGPPETVGDHDPNRGPGDFPESVAQPSCRLIGMFWEQDHEILAAGIRAVDAGVGTDKAVSRLGDQHAGRLTNHPHRLVEDDLDVPRVEADAVPDFRCARRRLHLTQRTNAAFRF